MFKEDFKLFYTDSEFLDALEFKIRTSGKDSKSWFSIKEMEKTKKLGKCSKTLEDFISSSFNFKPC